MAESSQVAGWKSAPTDPCHAARCIPSVLHTYPTHPAAHPPSHPPPPPSPSAPDIVLVSEDDDRPCVGGLQEAADDFVELSRLGLPWDLDGLGHAYTACSTDSPAVRPPPPPHGDSPVPQPCDAQIWDSPAHLHPSELPGPVSPPVAPCADPAVPAEADAPQTHPEPPHGGSHIWKMSRNGCTKPGEQHGEHSTPWGHTHEPSPLPFLCSLQCILPSHPQQLTPAFHPPFQSTPHHTPSPVGMNSLPRGSGFSNCHCSHTEASPQAPVLAFCKGLSAHAMVKYRTWEESSMGHSPGRALWPWVNSTATQRDSFPSLQPHSMPRDPQVPPAGLGRTSQANHPASHRACAEAAN